MQAFVVQGSLRNNKNVRYKTKTSSGVFKTQFWMPNVGLKVDYNAPVGLIKVTVDLNDKQGQLKILLDPGLGNICFVSTAAGNTKCLSFR